MAGGLDKKAQAGAASVCIPAPAPRPRSPVPDVTCGSGGARKFQGRTALLLRGAHAGQISPGPPHGVNPAAGCQVLGQSAARAYQENADLLFAPRHSTRWYDGKKSKDSCAV